ncbi:MAG: efflux RND transporter periplasmic adaptor subunit [Opitutales bacterium]
MNRIFPLSFPLVAGLFLATGFMGCGGESEEGAEVRVVAVATEVLQREDAYTVHREYRGLIQAREVASLSFDQGGQIAEVAFEAGEPVSKGATVAQLDRARLQARLAEAEAAVGEALSRLALAQVTLERVSETVAGNALPEQRRTEAEQEVAAAEELVKQRRAGVDSAQVSLEKATLRAPFDGIVIRRLTEPGQSVGAGQPVLELQRASPYEAQIGVPQRWRQHLRLGSQSPLVIEGKSVDAVLERLVERQDLATRTLALVFALSDGKAGVPGQVATLTLHELRQEPGYWVPLTALTEREHALWSLLILVEAPENRPEIPFVTKRLPVEVLHTESDRAFIRADPAPDTQFVTGGIHRLVTGQPVRPADPGEMSSSSSTAP